MTLSLPREKALWTIKSQQTSSVWVWRSHYGLTDPLQFTSSMDLTWSENRQPRVINRTPTVKPAFQSSSGREKKKERSEEKGIRVQAAHGNVSDRLHWNQGRQPAGKARPGREKWGILKPKTRSKKERWIKEKEGDGDKGGVQKKWGKQRGVLKSAIIFSI